MLLINTIDNIRCCNNYILATVKSSNIFEDFVLTPLQKVELATENATMDIMIEYNPNNHHLMVFGMFFGGCEGKFENISCKSQVNKKEIIERIRVWQT